MRVLLIANTLPPRDVSGVGEQVVQLAAGLGRRGFTVEVLGRGKGGARGPKVLFPLLVVPAALLALLRLRPEVVQVHESDGAFAALTTVLCRPFLRPRPLLLALLQVSYVRERRVIRPLRDGDRVLGVPGAIERRFRRFKAPVQILLGKLTARLADRVLAPSAVTAREIEEDYGVGPVAVLPNVTGGLDVAPEPWPEPVGDGYLLFVGRLRLRKGVEVLLAAVAELLRQGRAPRLLIAGVGEHEAALRATAKRLELGAAVCFLGRANAGQVRSLLAGARALVVPSLYEGMPLVVLEAMDAAVPVVASAVSGMPEVVTDGETGWLVPAENVAALATALAAVLDDAAEARRRGLAGQARLARSFRPDVAAKTWEDLLPGG